MLYLCSAFEEKNTLLVPSIRNKARKDYERRKYTLPYFIIL